MAPQRRTATRIDAAARDLLSGNGASVVVTLVAEREGLSRRQAQRIVHAAYRQLTADLEEGGVDRRELMAQLVSNLQSSISQSIATNQPGACVAAVRLLAELVGLTTPLRRQ